MNIFTQLNQTTARLVAAAAMFSMLLSALPVHFFNAQADETVSVLLSATPNPTGTDSDEEFVSIKFSEDVDLTGWVLTDTDGTQMALTGTASADTFYIVCANTDSGVNGGLVCDAEFAAGFQLANTGFRQVVLAGAGGNIIVSVNWTDAIEGESYSNTSPFTALEHNDGMKICHATASGSNPYNEQTPSVNSIFNAGHDAHDDIIPPFYYFDGPGSDAEVVYFEGLNWGDDTKEIYDNDCAPEVASVCAIGDNLLTNGSFEAPVISGSWALTSIDDWTVTAVDDGASIDGELWRGYQAPSEGEQNVELDSTEPTKISQTVVTTPGATYELTFDFRARDASAANNAVDVTADGVEIADVATSSRAWSSYAAEFIASDDSTDIVFADAGTDNGNGSLLDNAVLCLVKEAPALTYTSETIEVSGDTFSLAAPLDGGWWFNRDVNNATPIEFNKDEASIGDGSLYVEPISNSDAPRKFIGEYFSGQKIADTHSISYDFMIGAGGADTDANEYYMNVYANFGESASDKYYDCKYDVVPTVGTVGSFETITFDPTQTYPVTKGTQSWNLSPYDCPASPADMDSSSADSYIRMFALNMGDTSLNDADLDGHFDNVVNVVQTDDNVHTTIFDFETDGIEQCTVEIVSDTSDVVKATGLNAVEAWEHNAWTADNIITDAEWIWGSEYVVDATIDETQTFVKKFGFAGTVTAATLQVGSDNTHAAMINGDDSGSTTMSETFREANVQTYDVTSLVDQGNNELEIEVLNIGLAGKTSTQNPAGLLYKLTIEGEIAEDESCLVPYEEVDPSLTITNPATDYEILSGVHTFEAEYVDADDIVDHINWAIRAGSCDGASNNMVGNVSGMNDAWDLTGDLFTTTIDLTDWEGGDYCFVVNPSESSGDDFRELRWFTIEAEDPWCAYEGEVIEHTADAQALTNGGAEVDSDRRDPEAVETVASYQNVNGKEGSAWSTDDFYSLGINGYLVYEFADQVAYDQAGNDIAVYEITGGTGGSVEEKVEVSVSQDGITFVSLGEFTGDAEIDVSPAGLSYVKYVRLDDRSTGVQGTNGDGYDVDAIVILEGSCGDELLACEPGVNLVKNGSFERPVVEGTWDVFDTVPGWEIAWADDYVDAPTNALLEIHRSVFGWLSSRGDQHAELDTDWDGPGGSNGDPASVVITQEIDTIPGEEYTLSWDYSPRPGTTQPENDLDVFVDGEKLTAPRFVGEGTTAGDQTEWERFRYTFEADEDVTSIAFADDGDANSAGTLLDAVKLVCKPGPEAGPYCGDGDKNQDWEQCDTEEGCTDYCTWENQCQDLKLAKITLDSFRVENSPSFDGNIYLGTADSYIPSGTWFNLEPNDTTEALAIAKESQGLGVERLNGDIHIALAGDNPRRKHDEAYGNIEFLGVDVGNLKRNPVVGARLENNGINLDYLYDTNFPDNDVTFKLHASDDYDVAGIRYRTLGEFYDCEFCHATIEARVVLQDETAIDNAGAGNLAETVYLGDGSTTTFGTWFEVYDGTLFTDDQYNATNYPGADSVEGLIVSRVGDGQVKVVLHGFHEEGEGSDVGNYESLKATLEFRDASIDPAETRTLAGMYQTETHNGVLSPSNSGFDVVANKQDLSGVDFELWVSARGDGFSASVDLYSVASCDVDTVDTYPVKGDKYVSIDGGSDSLRSDWEFYAYNAETDATYTTSTDDSGRYHFDLPAGVWTITEEMPSGWSLRDLYQDGTATTSCELVLGDVDGRVTSVPGSSAGYNYCDFFNEYDSNGGGGEDDLYRVYGYVYHDDDENGVYGQDEFGLTGWVVSITDGTTTATTSVDANGLYEFWVPEGTWIITQELQNGWQRITQAESHTVVIPQYISVPDTVTAADAERTFAQMLHDFFIPVAHAVSVLPEIQLEYGSYEFGNNEASVTPTGTTGGSSSSPYCDLFDAVLDNGVYTLSWETRNGFDMTISADGTTVYTETDNTTIKAGSFDLTEAGQQTLELSVTRGLKEDTCGLDLSGPTPQVLGEQVSIVPLGGADAGAGGTSPVSTGAKLLLGLTTRRRNNA